MAQGTTNTQPAKTVPLDRDGNALVNENTYIRRLLEEILLELRCLNDTLTKG